jgi:hypothetical protein
MVAFDIIFRSLHQNYSLNEIDSSSFKNMDQALWPIAVHNYFLKLLIISTTGKDSFDGGIRTIIYVTIYFHT